MRLRLLSTFNIWAKNKRQRNELAKHGAQSYYLQLIAFPESINSDTQTIVSYSRLVFVSVIGLLFCYLCLGKWDPMRRRHRWVEKTWIFAHWIGLDWTNVTNSSSFIRWWKGYNCNEFPMKHKLNQPRCFTEVHENHPQSLKYHKMLAHTSLLI